MSDTERRLADIEKRLARLERLQERETTEHVVQWPETPFTSLVGAQWCACGRDVCRAPDCPTHKRSGE